MNNGDNLDRFGRQESLNHSTEAQGRSGPGKPGPGDQSYLRHNRRETACCIHYFHINCSTAIHPIFHLLMTKVLLVEKGDRWSKRNYSIPYRLPVLKRKIIMVGSWQLVVGGESLC